MDSKQDYERRNGAPLDPGTRVADALERIANAIERLVLSGPGTSAPAAPERDTIDTTEAAELCGYKPDTLRKLAKNDLELARCYDRGDGQKSRMKWSRKKLLAWKTNRV